MLDWYLSSWGPVDWTAVRQVSDLDADPELGRMLLALSMIEADSQVMRRKLAASGADRSPELLEFIAVWLAEEGEHSRALKHMARNYGTTDLAIDERRWSRDIRAFITWPSLYLGRRIPGLKAAYCTLGAMQELVALTTYNHLAQRCDTSPVSSALRAIAKQESRHMRFYRTAAEIFLGASPAAQRTTRVLIGKLWRPPGMDLIGKGWYEEIFGPILRDPQYTSALLRVDRIVSALPGIGSISVMREYLHTHEFPAPVAAVARREAQGASEW
ncbi:acyl-ACP desaturase [Kribbella sindirgiensis]|uniref:Ferritin-like domain-containing protein n=1 Tax=Kribbella sindirgiensis TaxID=1124744 RepID=A0A4V2M3L1_9ACTN|nr:acyl-ACP desaturase [Kribbella sindirgiensis]TCC32462.1 hypothetical protein E0H50_19990 [Kribbella sindirgiensis]